ncbi:MAG: amidase [Candidatus Abyssobacteria bacterium SURF_5]|uniref:Amidase n=1 Tax=Abyssobacteria bacterium (strain SURF_5) TaxID=2093360 RepID=A0A3A4NQS4_ABYX5|nr:MAG: amidase [Candidatus Abyssubacteria bacterium SURF_5]
MGSADELTFLDATAQAELVRRKELKPIEMVEAAIQRAERLNPKLNAIVTPMYEQAREAAKGALPNGPFTGVPFLLKDLGATYGGVRQTAGSAFLKDFIPDHDSELVARHKKAGLVVIGKTNTPEFGIVPTTEPHFFGPARNPWNTERSTGGSSGGSAAAVAAGIVPFAHANDGGGSIRIPASCCGLFGLKPTRARNSLGPDLGDMIGGLVAEHAVTRSVRDSAALLDATAGPVPGDPYWAPPQERPYLEEAKTDPGRLRIAFTTETGTGTPMSQDCIDAVRDAAKLCEKLGHRVTEAAPAVAGELVSQMFMTLYAAGHSWAISAFSMLSGRTPSEEHFEPLTWALYQMGKQVSASDYLMAVAGLQQISRQVARFMVDYDIWLNATLAEPPLPLGTLDSPPDDPLYGLMRSGAYVPYTPICNFTGQPAMSVPLYWNKEGLPIGTHFVARFGDEATLFRLAAQLEQARPWAERRPPLSA